MFKNCTSQISKPTRTIYYEWGGEKIQKLQKHGKPFNVKEDNSHIRSDQSSSGGFKNFDFLDGGSLPLG